MKGKYKIRVENSFVRFEFEIERNINIVRGDSGTGKTTLIGMIADYWSQGEESGVTLTCKMSCMALSGAGDNWQSILAGVRSSIVFIDEGEKYVRSKEFARFIRGSDNYYVIAVRDNLYELPYSVDAIYEIKKTGKYGKLKKTYNRFNRIYSGKEADTLLKANEVLLAEDSKSGFQFFSRVAEEYGMVCKTSNGKGNIVPYMEDHKEDKILVIADGAAFGPEMANASNIADKSVIKLFLPESFEWLILQSGLIKDAEIDEILARPYDYIESSEYFSWEQFFTKLLIDRTQGEISRYSKDKISEYYLSGNAVRRILGRFFEDV